jgi:hypothetical protein
MLSINNTNQILVGLTQVRTIYITSLVHDLHNLHLMVGNNGTP